MTKQELLKYLFEIQTSLNGEETLFARSTLQYIRNRIQSEGVEFGN